MATTTIPPKHIPQWTLADRMEKARKDAGLSTQEIADAIGISRKSVWNYEHGTTKPLRPILAAWAEVTGTYVEWLTGGDSPDFPQPAATGAPQRNRTHGTATRRASDKKVITDEYCDKWYGYPLRAAA